MQAPDLQVEKWFNTDCDINLADLRGKVVVIEAFQMLCPGCVTSWIAAGAKSAACVSSRRCRRAGSTYRV